MRKKLHSALVAMLLVLGPSIQTAQAQWVVTDPANLIQQIIKVGGQITQIANEGTQIANQVNQINHQLQQLRRLARGDFTAIAGFAAQQNADIADLLATATTMQYSLGSLQAEINAAYPQGAGQWGGFDMTTINARRQQWDALITEAGSTAARAQTSLGRIQTRNIALSNLMAAADVEDGDVRQMQISNQINGTLAQGMNELIAVQTTNNRLQMLEAQTDVAERELARERSRRNYAGFTDMGPAAVRLTALPEIQR